MESKILIKAENIFKSFNTVKNKKLEVLKGINIEIPSNKISVIVGASGAGKSTLLHILSCLDEADSGSVFFDDEDISKMNQNKIAKFRNHNFGFVFQFHHLLPEFTALENVSLPLLIAKKNKAEAFLKSEKILSDLGLVDRLHHKPAELSGGEQQRVAVARALANNPQMIFADEPTGNLDTANSELLINLFIDLRDNFNKTLLIVTHNKDLMNIADFVFEMKDGKLIT